MYISFIRTRGNMPAFLPYDGKISDRILEGNVSIQNYANCQSILLSRTFFSRVFMNLMVVMATRWVRLEILALANFKWRNPLWFMNRAISIEERSSEKAEVCYFIIFIIGLTSLEIKMDISWSTSQWKRIFRFLVEDGTGNEYTLSSEKERFLM